MITHVVAKMNASIENIHVELYMYMYTCMCIRAAFRGWGVYAPHPRFFKLI